MAAALNLNSNFYFPPPSQIELTKDALSNIRYFQQQWKYYCVATGLDKMPEKVKISVLFLSVGRETYYLLTDKLKLNINMNITAENILEVLENHFLPNENVVMERFNFNQAVQESDETYQEYLERLQQLVITCDYNENLKVMIRDRFISGVRDPVLRQELANDRNLTLETALSRCLKNETILNTSLNRNEASNLPAKSVKKERKSLELVNGDVETIHIETETFNVESDDDSAEQEQEPQQQEKTDEKNVDEGFENGSFIILKKDFSQKDPPIWKIDGPKLLQKFIPFQCNGETMYKNTTVYSGWCYANRRFYFPAPVTRKHIRKNQYTVKFCRENMKIEIDDL